MSKAEGGKLIRTQAELLALLALTEFFDNNPNLAPKSEVEFAALLDELLSAERERSKVNRARRIHDSYADGIPQKAIAADERVSVSTISRVLKKPRP